MSSGAAGAARVIAHLDLDAFYAQVERALDPSLRGRPVAVVQYNPFEQGGVKSMSAQDVRARVLDRGAKDFENHSLIAVSYEARACGVKRQMRAGEAARLAPECVFVQVPTRRSKADLTSYRDAGAKVAQVLACGGVIERASIDEAYLDLTLSANAALEEVGFEEVVARARRSHVAGASEAPAFVSKANLRAGSADGVVIAPATDGGGGGGGDAQEATVSEPSEPAAAPDPMAKFRPRLPDEASMAWWDREEHEWREEEKLLAAGAYICEGLRKRCVDELGYTLSAGIAPNKMLAKLTSGMNKPNSQTVLCPDHTENLLRDLPIDRIRGLGAKLGRELAEALDVKTIGELAVTPIRKLEHVVGEEKAQWVRKVSLGLDDDPVKAREMPKSIGTGKPFRGALALKSLEAVKYRLTELAAELNDRVEADEVEWDRTAKLLTLGLSSPDERGTSNGYCSRSCALRAGAAEKAQDALALVSKWASGRSNWSITGLSISASNFVSNEKDCGNVVEMFKNAAERATTTTSTTTPAVSPIKADQIDESVLAELPEEIQREIRASLFPKANNAGIGGGGGGATGGGPSFKKAKKNPITNYFTA